MGFEPVYAQTPSAAAVAAPVLHALLGFLLIVQTRACFPLAWKLPSEEQKLQHLLKQLMHQQRCYTGRLEFHE